MRMGEKGRKGDRQATGVVQNTFSKFWYIKTS